MAGLITPQQAIAPGAQILTWRKITPLHRDFGAQSIRLPIAALTGGVPLVLANFKYGPMTIDRVIGAYLALGGITAGTVSLSEVSGWSWQKTVAGANQSNYWINLETLTDGINLTFTSSVSITAAMLVYISLYNIEIAPGVT
jgi:hypothetical protein